MLCKNVWCWRQKLALWSSQKLDKLFQASKKLMFLVLNGKLNFVRLWSWHTESVPHFQCVLSTKRLNKYVKIHEFDQSSFLESNQTKRNATLCQTRTLKTVVKSDILSQNFDTLTNHTCKLFANQKINTHTQKPNQNATYCSVPLSVISGPWSCTVPVLRVLQRCLSLAVTHLGQSPSIVHRSDKHRERVLCQALSTTRGDCTLCHEYSFGPAAASIHPGFYTSRWALLVGSLIHIHMHQSDANMVTIVCNNL